MHGFSEFMGVVIEIGFLIGSTVAWEYTATLYFVRRFGSIEKVEGY
jgi:hypothetical protein